MVKRFLEINADGIAFHEPGPDSPFSTGAAVPPAEVLFCDCRGVGVICHHVYAAVPDHDLASHRVERHFDIHGPDVVEQHQDDWKAKHAGPRCRHRRQFFVDVTDRPDALLGMKYDEKTDTFSELPKETQR